ncbi:hypothetical protein M0638_22380 [Roseomonas sp. NAR14]|uniref:Uncharacterized protein n=1 Tax=Roseomonas acroporae TaxID=2937791 RepID=A0A9X2BZK2_9PROT|nr:hypothetical protein [Roseomonas acroporae]MCK8787125.1 hypothetical protein [Roseomonas acroporae]
MSETAIPSEPMQDSPHRGKVASKAKEEIRRTYERLHAGIRRGLRVFATRDEDHRGYR